MGVITSLFARKMLAAAGADVDARALLNSVGLDPDGIADPKAMISDTAYYSLLERIAETVDATCLPLRTGASMRCDDYGALGLAWKSAPTLLGSLSRVERYARLWTNVVEYELRPEADGMMFILHRAGPRRLGLRLSNEATLASTVSLSRQVRPDPFAPREVHFRHPPPGTIAEHERYFGCPVYFGSEVDALLISRETLAEPNMLGDEGISRFLLGHLDAELDAVKDNTSIEGMTRHAIARSLSEGLPKMADIADRLGMSARSFHRRLAEHGLSFQTLADSTRQEFAEGLLREDRYSLAEVAFLTGFAEQSSFNRAFKRWADETPAGFRKQAVAKEAH